MLLSSSLFGKQFYPRTHTQINAAADARCAGGSLAGVLSLCPLPKGRHCGEIEPVNRSISGVQPTTMICISKELRLTLFGVLASSLAQAQSPAPCEIRGSVFDTRGGEALANVEILLVGSDSPIHGPGVRVIDAAGPWIPGNGSVMCEILLGSASTVTQHSEYLREGRYEHGRKPYHPGHDFQPLH